MVKIPKFLGLHAKPTTGLNWSLTLLPFILLILLYSVSSHIRLENNPSDKLLPSFTKMVEAVKRMAFTEDKRTGDYLMLKDTISSLRRLGIGVILAAISGLFLGLHIGVFPGVRSLLKSFIAFMSIIPPLAILPILFISFGIGELAKVVLIFIGTFFLITRDIGLVVRKIPKEQTIKALTLGATPFHVTYKIIMPQIIPRLLDVTRLQLGTAWLFLIASESIASTDGLGYRIFLVRRYLAMDVIIPYVFWITIIGFALDYALIKFVRCKYPWYVSEEKD